MSQRGFFDDDIQSRFEEFDRLNPEVWDAFVRFAWDARKAGQAHYSADAILHRIRWWLTIDTRSLDDFKINNNFSSRYARKLIASDRTFDGFFELRKIRAS